MSVKKISDRVRTWIELDPRAAERNYRLFRRLVGPRTGIWAVVKSNAYGHGIFAFTGLANRFGIDGFCVDSILEGIALRRTGIRKPILVLGPTLPLLMREARNQNLILSISQGDALQTLLAVKAPPVFHLKIDTGMHRQGFFVQDLPRVLGRVRHAGEKAGRQFQGIFTHFADPTNRVFTGGQFRQFEEALRLTRRAGYPNIVSHCAGTGGALLFPKYHCSLVRVGMGLYGYPPSRARVFRDPRFDLSPVLRWRTVVLETKMLPKGSYVGYDLGERLKRPTFAAVLPVGYWHGFPRSLSQIGEVLIRGRRARVLGRVSMDLLVVDATGIRCRVGDVVTMLGRDGREHLDAMSVAESAGTTHYELLTRLNPLIERVLIHERKRVISF